MSSDNYTVIGYWNRFDRDATPILAHAVVLSSEGKHYLSTKKGLELIEEFERWESDEWISSVPHFQTDDVSRRFLIHENLEGVKSEEKTPELCASYLSLEEEQKLCRELRSAYLQKIAKRILSGDIEKQNWELSKNDLGHALRADYSDLGLHLLAIATAQDGDWLHMRIEELKRVLQRK
jgi:hypothetical protein